MSIKSTLLADFDADIEKATGYDKQDLQVVRALIDRTEDTDQKTFMIASEALGRSVKKTPTCGLPSGKGTKEVTHLNPFFIRAMFQTY
ncbi:MAG: hypothetical protein IPP10_19520 [Candidatus Competibacteraceae bacterium]|nr:hypothetical protein [Candidatus Competibacteraceae bacterium]